MNDFIYLVWGVKNFGDMDLISIHHSLSDADDTVYHLTHDYILKLNSVYSSYTIEERMIY